MKLLDPLGGLLTTTGSILIHCFYCATYICLFSQSFNFSLDGKNFFDLCGCYLIPSHFFLIFAVALKIPTFTYYQGV